MTVAENLFLNDEPSMFGFIVNEKSLRREARTTLELVGLEVDPGMRVSELTAAEQQLVDVARALRRNVQVLLLDEPTATLGPTEAQVVYAGVKRAVDMGTGCVFISHNLDEIYGSCTRAVVLRDGRSYGPVDLAMTAQSALVALMTGDQSARLLPKLEPGSEGNGRALVVIQHRVSSGTLNCPDIPIRAGLVTGLTGPVGGGAGRIAEIVAGVSSAKDLHLTQNGRPLRMRSPRDAMRKRIYRVPDARLVKGLAESWSVKNNISLPWIGQAMHFGMVRRPQEERISIRACDRMNVVRTSVRQPVSTLSGGNQQKVLIAKWISAVEAVDGSARDAVFVFSEPTEGVDINTRPQIWGEILTLAKSGAGVLVVSSDVEELSTLCSDVYVCSGGLWSQPLSGSEVDDTRIVNAVMNA